MVGETVMNSTGVAPAGIEIVTMTKKGNGVGRPPNPKQHNSILSREKRIRRATYYLGLRTREGFTESYPLLDDLAFKELAGSFQIEGSKLKILAEKLEAAANLYTGWSRAADKPTDALLAREFAEFKNVVLGVAKFSGHKKFSYFAAAIDRGGLLPRGELALRDVALGDDPRAELTEWVKRAPRILDILKVTTQKVNQRAKLDKARGRSGRQKVPITPPELLFGRWLPDAYATCLGRKFILRKDAHGQYLWRGAGLFFSHALTCMRIEMVAISTMATHNRNYRSKVRLEKMNPAP